MTRAINLTAIAKQIEDERARIRAKVQPQIDAEWAEIEARQAADTAERNAIVEVNRERRARIAQLREQRQMAEAQDATTEGAESMAIDTPTTPTPTNGNGRKVSTHQRIQREMAEAGKRGKPTAKKGGPTGHGSAAAERKAVAQTAKNVRGKSNGAVKSGTVHIRKRKQGDFILVKDPKVYGSRENWAVGDTFKTEQGAIDAAKKHGLKVAAK